MNVCASLLLLLCSVRSITEMNATQYLQKLPKNSTQSRFSNKCTLCKKTLLNSAELGDATRRADFYSVLKCPFTPEHLYHTKCFVDGNTIPVTCPLDSLPCGNYWNFRLWDFVSTYNAKTSPYYNTEGANTLLNCVLATDYPGRFNKVFPRYVTFDEVTTAVEEIRTVDGKQELKSLLGPLQYASEREIVWRSYGDDFLRNFLVLNLDQFSTTSLDTKCTHSFIAGLTTGGFIDLLNHVITSLEKRTAVKSPAGAPTLKPASAVPQKPKDEGLAITPAALIYRFVVSHKDSLTPADLVNLIKAVISNQHLEYVYTIFNYYNRDVAFTVEQIVDISQTYTKYYTYKDSCTDFCFLYAQLTRGKLFQDSELNTLKVAFLLPTTDKTSKNKQEYNEAVETVIVYKRVSQYGRSKKVGRVQRYLKKNKISYLFYLKFSAALSGISKKDLDSQMKLFWSKHWPERSLNIYRLFPSEHLVPGYDQTLLGLMLKYQEFADASLLLGVIAGRKNYTYLVLNDIVNMLIGSTRRNLVDNIMVMSPKSIFEAMDNVMRLKLLNRIGDLGMLHLVPLIDEYVGGLAEYRSFMETNLSVVMSVVVEKQARNSNNIIDTVQPKPTLDFYYKNIVSYLSEVLSGANGNFTKRQVQQIILDLGRSSGFQKFINGDTLGKIHQLFKGNELFVFLSDALFCAMQAPAQIAALKCKFSDDLPGDDPCSPPTNVLDQLVELFSIDADQFNFIEVRGPCFYNYLKNTRTNVFLDYLNSKSPAMFIQELRK
ncbi:hypothetical protein PAPHI01_0933 [Pancytospora philotis]|nr:hypothetical protein PAPHI01_0933 [Pancytospora philotis]